MLDTKSKTCSREKGDLETKIDALNKQIQEQQTTLTACEAGSQSLNTQLAACKASSSSPSSSACQTRSSSNPITCPGDDAKAFNAGGRCYRIVCNGFAGGAPNDLGSLAGYHSLQQCVERCNQISNCAHAVFYTPAKACGLRSTRVRPGLPIYATAGAQSAERIY
ncbi:hypothetical protein BJX66DRAFT_170302 [Aspergillus keveii]|uniref:Apple domain-containing protein n=1 Tax=Aspergillus keveii TaxID=714993 RepID=A0ABR4G8S0_9EURO